jgi:SWI/SNF-related matrix-associated actin-dependent regulator of chromatin subfamily A-like protein 1
LYELQGLAKLPGIKEWLMEFAEEGHKIVIFAYHRSVQQEILSWFPGAPSVMAGQSEDQTQTNIDRFQNDPECKQIICSSVVAQEAITLNAASYMAVCEEMWTEKAMEQMAGRIDRGKVTKSMMMYHLNDMTEGSTDRIMMAIRELKAELGKINSIKYFMEKLMGQ